MINLLQAGVQRGYLGQAMTLCLASLRKFLTKKQSNCDVKSVINSEVMILYPDSLVRVTSHIQTLIINLVQTRYGGQFQRSPQAPRLSRPLVDQALESLRITMVEYKLVQTGCQNCPKSNGVKLKTWKIFVNIDFCNSILDKVKIDVILY